MKLKPMLMSPASPPPPKKKPSAYAGIVDVQLNLAGEGLEV